MVQNFNLYSDMSKTAIVILVGSGVLLAAGAMLYVFSQDARRKKAYSTPVPPDYALAMIKKTNGVA